MVRMMGDRIHFKTRISDGSDDIEMRKIITDHPHCLNCNEYLPFNFQVKTWRDFIFTVYTLHTETCELCKGIFSYYN
jgi:hypothetical protein